MCSCNSSDVVQILVAVAKSWSHALLAHLDSRDTLVITVSKRLVEVIFTRQGTETIKIQEFNGSPFVV